METASYLTPEPYRSRPCPALARTPALRRSAILALAFAITLPLFAGVTYDQTVRTGSFDSLLFLPSRVPSLDPPVFDIPVNMYAPPLESARPETFKIVLQEGRLVRIGKDDSTIYSYSIEGLDEAQKRVSALFRNWASWQAPQYEAAIQKTGQTKQIEGQTAEEYRLIALPVGWRRVEDYHLITTGVAWRRVGGSSI
ncbi:MAG: hypothetical protein ABSH32_26235 [Bryobacteraceae bacterium]